MPYNQLENLKEIRDGEAGTEDTVREMAMLVDEAKKKLGIRNLASDIVYHIPERDYWAEVSEILYWVQTNIRFVNDINNVEFIQAPEYVVYSGSGDCDDMSTLTAALLESIGYQTAFVTIKADKSNKTQYSHVYLVVFINDEMIPLDPSQNKPLGWEPPIHYGKQIWYFHNGELHKIRPKGKNMSGMGKLNNNDIKGAVMNFFSNLGRGRQQQQADEEVEPRINPKPTETGDPVYDENKVRIPTTDPRRYPTVDLSQEEYDGIFDRDKYSYYGDDGTRAPGTYSMTPVEPLYDRGPALQEIIPVRSYPLQNFRRSQHLDEKFENRQEVKVEGSGPTIFKDSIKNVKAPVGPWGGNVAERVYQ